MPEVSVFIPAYNLEKFVGRAIESVMRQSFSNWELVIVDDCSTDNTFAICETYAAQDNRIKVYRNSENLGMMRNWNVGLGLCHTEFFTKLDGDDYWHERLLEKTLSVMKSDLRVGMVVSRYRLVNEHGIESGNGNTFPDFASNKSFTGISLVKMGVHGVFKYDLMRQGIGLIRREAFTRVAGFKVHDSGDTEMWFRIAAHYDVFAIDEPLYFYRTWSNSYSRVNVVLAGRQAKMYFETRMMIFEYYHTQGMLTLDEYKALVKDNLYEYRTSLIGEGWHENTVNALKLLLQNFATFPLRTIIFYSGRLKDKVIKVNRNNTK